MAGSTAAPKLTWMNFRRPKFIDVPPIRLSRIERRRLLVLKPEARNPSPTVFTRGFEFAREKIEYAGAMETTGNVLEIHFTFASTSQVQSCHGGSRVAAEMVISAISSAARHPSHTRAAVRNLVIMRIRSDQRQLVHNTTGCDPAPAFRNHPSQERRPLRKMAFRTGDTRPRRLPRLCGTAAASSDRQLMDRTAPPESDRR
jgi:hypothetical protein